MAKISTHPIAPIIATSERWKQTCLIGDGSLFSNSQLWTLANVNQFKNYFVDNLMYGGEQSFYEKFEIQLANAPAEVKQLSAEMLYILLLFPSNITASKKAKDIRLVWDWSGQSLDEVFPGLEESLAKGVGSTGMAYNNLRWREFAFFTTWLSAFKALPVPERQRLLSDPWLFGNWLDKTEGADKRQLRHIVLFLLFSDYFETSSSRNQKNQILTSFQAKVGAGSPLIVKDDSDWIKKDKNILFVRDQLTEEAGEPINFYLSPYKELWLTVPEEDFSEVDMRELFSNILEKYPSARATTSFGGQHEIRSLFDKLKDSVSSLDYIKNNSNLLVKYSYGKGNWAETPWLSILDKRETTTTQKGTYVVILFRSDGDGCHLKLGQGVTEITKDFGSGVAATEELQRRADQVRGMFPEMMNTVFGQARDENIEKRASLTGLYEASTIYSKYYKRDSMPSNAEIAGDIKTLIDCYKKYADSYQPVNPNLTKKIWAIATGKDGSQWDDFLNNGVAAIGFQDIGSLDQYKTQDEITEKLLPLSGDGSKPTNDSLCMFQFAKEIQIGDIVVAKSGRKLIRGAGVIKSEYIYDPARPDHPHLRKVEWLKTTETEFPSTGTATKTLTEISRYSGFKLFVENYLNMHTPSIGPYGVQQIIDEGCFASLQEIQGMIERLKSKKNIILQGPPGTGKTWLAKRLGYALIGEKNLDQLKPVQFHPNLSYEDFVRGWRPSGEGKLSLIDGPFMEAINKAKSSSVPYVVVIEEINRGNPAQIFGEMLTLLESNKRNADEGLELSYRKSDDERVYIPENLYVIGTMNIADRSLALVDLALRRRFAFIDLKPNINGAWKSWLVDKIKIPSSIANEIQRRINLLNDQISNDQSLGAQYQIGHSYVTPTSPIADAEKWFKQIVQTEIYPLLNEYWFDNPDNAIKIRDQLLQDF